MQHISLIGCGKQPGDEAVVHQLKADCLGRCGWAFRSAFVVGYCRGAFVLSLGSFQLIRGNLEQLEFH